MYAGVPLKAENYDCEAKPDGTFDGSSWFKGPKPVVVNVIFYENES